MEKGGKKRGDVEKHDGGEAGKKEIGRARVRIEEQLGGACPTARSARSFRDAAEGFIEAYGGSNVDGLAGDGGVRAINEHQDLRAHVVEQAVGVIDRNLDPDARFAGDDEIVQIMIILKRS